MTAGYDAAITLSGRLAKHWPAPDKVLMDKVLMDKAVMVVLSIDEDGQI